MAERMRFVAIAGLLCLLPGSIVWSIAPAAGADSSQALVRTDTDASSTPSEEVNSTDQTAPRKKGIIKRTKHALKKLHEKVSERINALRTAKVFDIASKAFPAFCDDWERKLRDRERDNVGSIQWENKDGWKVGHYVGYGKIKQCETKQSSHGIPIGELSYSEFEYYVTGKSVEEARHSKPKAAVTTNTTEIFRWDKNHWDY